VWSRGFGGSGSASSSGAMRFRGVGCRSEIAEQDAHAALAVRPRNEGDVLTCVAEQIACAGFQLRRINGPSFAARLSGIFFPLFWFRSF